MLSSQASFSCVPWKPLQHISNTPLASGVVIPAHQSSEKTCRTTNKLLTILNPSILQPAYLSLATGYLKAHQTPSVCQRDQQPASISHTLRYCPRNTGKGSEMLSKDYEHLCPPQHTDCCVDTLSSYLIKCNTGRLFHFFWFICIYNAFFLLQQQSPTCKGRQ